MITDIPNRLPPHYSELEQNCKNMGFTMPSDLYIGALLRTLVASKPNGHFLELGTGASLSLSWLIDGMDQTSSLITIDNDPKLIKVANTYFGNDPRVSIICADGSEWITNYSDKKFDLIFADAWPGKYSDLDATLGLLQVGGFYVIDDMLHQPNWPEGHAEKVETLIEYLETREELNLTKMNWSTGIVMAVKA